MITREHAAALQAWAHEIAYGDRALYVDGVDCSCLLEAAPDLAPREWSRRVREYVDGVRCEETLA